MIYLVEDDDNIRKLVCYALSKEGFKVQGYSCPKEFWQGVNIELPELVLLDIMLPEEDGLSILKKLKDDAGTEHIPVIMLTAKGSEFDKVTGLDMGADDYVAKPFGFFSESRTLDVHIRKLRVKLGDAGKMIQTIKGIGYKLGNNQI